MVFEKWSYEIGWWRILGRKWHRNGGWLMFVELTYFDLLGSDYHVLVW